LRSVIRNCIGYYNTWKIGYLTIWVRVLPKFPNWKNRDTSHAHIHSHTRTCTLPLSFESRQESHLSIQSFISNLNTKFWFTLITNRMIICLVNWRMARPSLDCCKRDFSVSPRVQPKALGLAYPASPHPGAANHKQASNEMLLCSQRTHRCWLSRSRHPITWKEMTSCGLAHRGIIRHLRPRHKNRKPNTQIEKIRIETEKTIKT
jgi:hypothetical protein